MKTVMLLVQSTNVEIIVAALNVIQRMIQSQEMKENWTKFLELIVLKIIDCYKVSKEVSSTCEMCLTIRYTYSPPHFLYLQVGRKIDYIIPRIAEHLPLDPTINILNPIIKTGAFPANLCAIKIMTDLAEKQGNQLSDAHLDSIMNEIGPVSITSQAGGRVFY